MASNDRDYHDQLSRFEEMDKASKYSGLPVMNIFLIPLFAGEKISLSCCTKPMTPAGFDSKHKNIPLINPSIGESNASDVELCYFQGKTILYFTGSDQSTAGDLQ